MFSYELCLQIRTINSRNVAADNTRKRSTERAFRVDPIALSLAQVSADDSRACVPTENTDACGWSDCDLLLYARLMVRRDDAVPRAEALS